MKSIGFAGSFDPITNGHVYVIEEALKLADTVEIVVSVNPSKKYMFTSQERSDMIKNIFIGKPVNVHIVDDDYVASYFTEIGCTHMIRGIRNASDFEYEKLIQRANMTMFGNIQTLFIMPPSDLESVSSSFVKGLIGPNNWTTYVKKLVPKKVFNYILIKELKTIYSDTINHCSIEAVFDCYNNDNRYYHTLEHIYNMTSEIIDCKLQLHNENLLLWAILYHDIVYNKKSNSYYNKHVHIDVSDEKNSKNIWELDHRDFILKYKVNGRDSEIVSKLIMSTEYSNIVWKIKERSTLEKYMISADMAILGKNSIVYNEYKNNIRKEYSQYSDEEYNKGRIRVLVDLKEKIENDLIYFYEFSKYKEKAISNITNEIKELESET